MARFFWCPVPVTDNTLAVGALVGAAGTEEPAEALAGVVVDTGIEVASPVAGIAAAGIEAQQGVALKIAQVVDIQAAS